MAKSIRELSERIAKVDAAVELVDARIPVSGRNPVLAELLKNKPHIVILTKADLADAEQTKRWIATFREQGIYAFSCNSKSGEGCNRLHSEIQTVLREKIERRNARGLGALAIKLMVVGIPNVGKSSFINRLSGKKAARAEDRPGVTRTSTWIRLRDGIDLLDTPGLLWPKLDPPQAGMHLAVTGAVRDEILDTTELAAELAGELVTIVPKTMAEKCGTGIAVENMVDFRDNRRRYCGGSPDELLQLIERINDPDVGICLDTGHANIAGLACPELVRMFGPHLRATHINDNRGKYGDEHLLPYFGSIDWPGVMTALKEVGYGGDFSFEIGSQRIPAALRPQWLTYTAAVGNQLLSLAN